MQTKKNDAAEIDGGTDLPQIDRNDSGWYMRLRPAIYTEACAFITSLNSDLSTDMFTGRFKTAPHCHVMSAGYWPDIWVLLRRV